MTAPSTLLDRLAHNALQSRRVNPAVMALPAAILWTDEKREWESQIRALQQAIPQLHVLGDYDALHRQGPAIWLKCVVAAQGTGTTGSQLTPIIYLPGVNRHQLRAVETCPRDLQPLAELQYRGAYFSQDNGKDWTLYSFLSATRGGLGLTLDSRDSVQPALQRAYDSGELLEQTSAELERREITADWLDSLLSQNPARDVLTWLNDVQGAQNRWNVHRWDVFEQRCLRDFGFDPLTDGPLVATENLATRSGPWGEVWHQYRDGYQRFVGVTNRLLGVAVPDDILDLEGFPAANERAEGELRTSLSQLADSDVVHARIRISELERDHAHRRGWLWASQGRAPLAQALEHLALAAKLSKHQVAGATPDEMATHYAEKGWRVDSSAMRALAAVRTAADTVAISAALRTFYEPWLDGSARKLQNLAVLQLPAFGQIVRRGYTLAESTCVIFVDGLRYDLARALESELGALGHIRLQWQWTSVPSLTASGKPWCSPVADQGTGVDADIEFEPSIAVTGKPFSTAGLRKLLVDAGYQILATGEPGDATGRAWTEVAEIDHTGHESPKAFARALTHELDRIVERVADLRDAGWKHVRIVTDHGWLFLPGGLPKVELAQHSAETKWGRSAVLKAAAADVPLTLGWSWNPQTRIALAPGIGAFRKGIEYSHGGLSVQESVVPVLEISMSDGVAAGLSVQISEVNWTGMRCRIEVASVETDLIVDLRTRVNDEGSSAASASKPLTDGKASLVVPDDSLEGNNVHVVVINARGQVLAKQSTRVGG